MTPESPQNSQNKLASLKTYPINLEVPKESRKGQLIKDMKG